MIWARLWCSAAANAGLCDGAISPLARAPSTSRCASSGSTPQRGRDVVGAEFLAERRQQQGVEHRFVDPAQPLDQRDPGGRAIAAGRAVRRTSQRGRPRDAPGTAGPRSPPRSPGPARRAATTPRTSAAMRCTSDGVSGLERHDGRLPRHRRAQRGQRRLVRQRFGGDDDRRGGVADQLDQPLQVGGVEQVRVVDDHRRVRRVTGSRGARDRR